MNERFSRVSMLFGEDKLAMLHKAKVAVFGLGGVGSYAAEALARSGVGEIALIDFDRVEISNINRQILALDSTLGRLKTDVCAERINDINPECRLQLFAEFFDERTLSKIFSALDSYIVLDCIDTFNSKTLLIKHCLENDIPVFSSMGAAGKKDPSQIKLADISKTSVCPLARKIRKYLVKNKIKGKLPVVFSTEPFEVSSDSLLFEKTSQKDASSEDSALPEKPPLGALCHITAIFGLMLAASAINYITEN
ncbi:MAG: tRNA threonylcarbamoyladenosine dehydratase [Candidatus Riflebacteria bacterium]|nr:tRNA threonylcarbamoyladenosine dehydratase [Candidatus Riflebacteria bacterium]